MKRFVNVILRGFFSSSRNNLRNIQLYEWSSRSAMVNYSLRLLRFQWASMDVCHWNEAQIRRKYFWFKGWKNYCWIIVSVCLTLKFKTMLTDFVTGKRNRSFQAVNTLCILHFWVDRKRDKEHTIQKSEQKAKNTMQLARNHLNHFCLLKQICMFKKGTFSCLFTW